jgi:hypothetical protein
MTSAACPQLATVAEAARIPEVSVAGCWSWPPPPMTFGLPSPRPLTAASSCRRVGRCQVPASQDIHTGPAASLTAPGISAWEDSPRTDRPQTQTRKGGKGRQGCGY